MLSNKNMLGLLNNIDYENYLPILIGLGNLKLCMYFTLYSLRQHALMIGLTSDLSVRREEEFHVFFNVIN